MIKFTIPGEPVAQGRPRFSTKTGRAYDPGKSKDYKSYIKFIVSGVEIDEPIIDALKVNLTVFKSIPNSWTKTKKQMALEGNLRPTTRPDLDNYAKIVLDACNGIIFKDDSQVVELSVRKFYSECPGIKVEIEVI